MTNPDMNMPDEIYTDEDFLTITPRCRTTIHKHKYISEQKHKADMLALLDEVQGALDDEFYLGSGSNCRRRNAVINSIKRRIENESD